MKYLGIDYGTKKIGIATSDDGGSLAFPHSVMPNTASAHASIVEFAHTNNIAHVVMGLSLPHNGIENAVTTAIEEFKVELEGQGFAVHLEPEFYTTQQAKRTTNDTLADASAAALILQSYLDTHTQEHRGEEEFV